MFFLSFLDRLPLILSKGNTKQLKHCTSRYELVKHKLVAYLKHDSPISIRACSYEPSNWTGLGYRDEFCCLSIWEISARLMGMKFEKQNIKMVEDKNVSFSTIIALLTLVTLLLELFWPASYFAQKPAPS